MYFVTASRESYRLSSDKVIVTGHGIDTERFRPLAESGKSRKEQALLSVGRISPRKNYETLIKAMDILVHKRKHAALTLMIVGGASGIERTLGLPEGYLQDFDAVRVDIPSAENQNLRIPSGNEAGANDYWAPGGLLPGGMLEAVIDVASVPKETLTIVDLRDPGEV